MATFFRCVSLILLALVASCGGGAQDGVGSAAAIATAQMARAVAPSCSYDHVYVTVEKILIDQGAGSTEVTLPSPRRIDLVGLSNGVLHALGTAPLSAGHYTAVRLLLAANSASGSAGMANAVQPTGGSLTPLTPSAQQSGLKLQADFDVAAGQMADLVLDFDACESVVLAGNSGRYVLKPVIIAGVVEQGERKVNTSGVWSNNSAIATLKDGSYVVTWTLLTDAYGHGDHANVYAQRFDRTGRRLGDEMRVNTTTADDRYASDIAGLSDGGFVVTWPGSGQVGIYSQRFDASGARVGAETRVDSTGRLHWQSTVAAFNAGGYVVAWSSYSDSGTEFDVYTQRFDESGAPVGSETRVNSITPYWQIYPVVATLKDGGYVVAWESQTWVPWVFLSEVHAQRFDRSGAPVGDETQVNANTSSGGPTYAEDLAITGLADGGYLLAWTWSDQSDPDSGFRIYARHIDASGAPVGNQSLVNTTTISHHGVLGTKVAMLSDGGYVLAWTFGSDQTADDIYAQRFDASDTRVGLEVRINTTVAGYQGMPDISAMTDGGYVVTWQSLLPDIGSDIYMQRFDANDARE